MRHAAIALLAAVLLVGCDDGSDVPKPEWWLEPEGDGGEPGLPWPPPEPEGHEDTWPPGEPDRSNPQFWVDHFRAKKDDGSDDPSTAANVTKDGELGNIHFANMFVFIDSDRPECGLFATVQPAQEIVPGCTPFPSEAIARVCKKSLDAVEAKNTCNDACRQQRKCRQSRLFVPEMWVRWKCTPREDQSDLIEASCNAMHLCECFEQ